MKVALVHDWLTGMRGGEKVLERLAAMYPQAPIYTLVHEPGSTSPQLENREIRTSVIQRLPARGAYRWYLPFFPLAIRWMDLSEFDLVISSSHCAAKAVRTRPDTLHLCYCHTPMRYAWDQFDAYFSPRRVGWPRHLLIRPTMAWLRRWDRATAGRVDDFMANSRHVAGRIDRYYARQAIVIPPPVDVERFTPSGDPPDDYYLMVTALSPYKRVEVAIAAFNTMGRRLVIAGWGPERERLQAMAGPTVELAGRVSDERLLELYRGCRAFVLPGVEDAGIAPVEAMACGRPALVAADGGAPEAVVPGETGLLIPEPSSAALAEVVDTAERLSFNTERIRQHALAYSVAEFDRRVGEFVASALARRGGDGDVSTGAHA